MKRASGLTYALVALSLVLALPILAGCYWDGGEYHGRAV
jgi:hypothetical protein